MQTHRVPVTSLKSYGGIQALTAVVICGIFACSIKATEVLADQFAEKKFRKVYPISANVGVGEKDIYIDHTKLKERNSTPWERTLNVTLSGALPGALVGLVSGIAISIFTGSIFSGLHFAHFAGISFTLTALHAGIGMLSAYHFDQEIVNKYRHIELL